jgi:hypothetical protein
MTASPALAADLSPVSAEAAIRLRSPLAVRTGRPGTIVDDTVARALDHGTTGEPVIPATVIKGAARAALIRYEHPFDAAHVVDAFGDEGDHPGVLRFTTARATDHDAVVGSVTNVALTAERTARPGRLRTVEVVEELGRRENGELDPVTFHTTVRADPTVGSGEAGVRRERAERSLAIGLCGLAAVTHVGSRTNRGLGSVEVVIDPTRSVQPDRGPLDELLTTYVFGSDRSRVGADEGTRP